ncbi:MAG: hypothetical protein RMI34_00625 [Chloroherpetonaceae bacterium]|nr:hypothetical protein [Chloroherpetonaceae bacterium]MCS7212360.1 hypothetical protein [Chloroherpetonaceae bacterium]MDW8018563.1 hypothetical protein [Chloroherpetonaceae bacterium]MDW8467337.1 hypothetical protein [Chloroherpetonaceae bacterium]
MDKQEKHLTPEAALEELERYVEHLVSENLALRREKEALLRQLEEQTHLANQLLQQHASLAPVSSDTAQPPTTPDEPVVVLTASERLYFKERLTHLLERITLELHRLDASGTPSS